MSFTNNLAGLRGIRLHRARRSSEMAELIGVTPSSYTRFENGYRRIYFDKACILADTLGVRVDDLRRYRSEDELVALLGPAGGADSDADAGIVVTAGELEGWETGA